KPGHPGRAFGFQRGDLGRDLDAFGRASMGSAHGCTFERPLVAALPRAGRRRHASPIHRYLLEQWGCPHLRVAPQDANAEMGTWPRLAIQLPQPSRSTSLRDLLLLVDAVEPAVVPGELHRAESFTERGNVLGG